VYVWLTVGFALAVPYFFYHVGAATQAQKFHVYVQPLSHAFLFLAGGAIVDLRQRTQLRLDPRVAYAGLLALLALALSRQARVVDHADLLEGTTRLSGVGVAIVAVLFCACTRGGRSRGLEGLVWLGEHSYALYLLHPFTQGLTERTLAAGAGPLCAFGLGLASSFSLAALAHRAIERPCMALGRRVSG
jgi:peptidoglycan/LPS O-acetylase OafA/YrhL